jgi:UDP-N-acetylglucosamine--N-acetylmuramyl-(pentapeptide) pyrophosphoryl-undecaprenol N-acetylglucosamine transferase
MRVIISGGGTGGHIFPAVSIANALKKQDDKNEILFVGASGKMEMEKVPSAGYKIVGLPIRGFQRGRYIQNISALFLLVISLIKSVFVVKKFKPDVIVGVGGYASGAIAFIGSKFRVPIVLQEQNSYAGLTNKLLAKKAKKICVAYKGLEKYFPAEKIKITGNPVRKNLLEQESREESIEFYNLDKAKKTIMVLGGSLGARSLNIALYENLDKLSKANYQIIWQVGKLYYKEYQEKIESLPTNIQMVEFINDMNKAYACSDLIVTRAGAGTISELCLLQKACIFVPSPNVAEDHQTKNAMAVVNEQAGEIINDKEITDKLVEAIDSIIQDDSKLDKYRTNILKLAVKNSDELIVKEIYKSVGE